MANPKENLLVISKTREAAKEKELRVAEEFLTALNEHLHATLEAFVKLTRKKDPELELFYVGCSALIASEPDTTTDEPEQIDTGGIFIQLPKESKVRATELEWLRWFCRHADFGPADSDVRDSMQRTFMEETGKSLPKGWNFNSSGEEIDP